jgi:hypothetical protein
MGSGLALLEVPPGFDARQRLVVSEARDAVWGQPRAQFRPLQPSVVMGLARNRWRQPVP